MAIDPQTYLIAFGIIILIAFLGHVIFQRTKVPDVILLLGLGVLLGPLMPILFPGTQPVLDPVIFQQLLPLLAAVAIIVILFDGGLKLNIKDLFVGVAPATLVTLLVFVASVILTAGVLVLLGAVENPWVGVLFGVIVGGTSSVVVMPIVERMTLSRRTRTIVGLESALTDVLVVVLTISLSLTIGIQVAGGMTSPDGQTGGIDPQGFTQNIVQKFAVGIAIGLIGGLVWVHRLRLFTQRSYEYMLTLALLFLCYSITEFLNGSGALAVLAFGLVMGNSRKRDLLTGTELRRARERHQSRHRWVPIFNIDLVNLHNEIVFFVRAFFFVALGVILDVNVFLNPRFIGISLVILVGLVLARVWGVLIVFWKGDVPTHEKTAMGFLMPRGLAAAALAAVPFTQYGVVDGIATVDDFVAYAVMILVLTNIVVSVGVYLYENERFRRRFTDWLEQRQERRLERQEERIRRRTEARAARLAAQEQKRNPPPGPYNPRR